MFITRFLDNCIIIYIIITMTVTLILWMLAYIFWELLPIHILILYYVLIYILRRFFNKQYIAIKTTIKVCNALLIVIIPFIIIVFATSGIVVTDIDVNDAFEIHIRLPSSAIVIGDFVYVPPSRYITVVAILVFYTLPLSTICIVIIRLIILFLKNKFFC
jgi:hypothetical protein